MVFGRTYSRRAGLAALMLAALLSGCQKSAPELLVEARTAIVAKDSATAIIHLKGALAVDPNNAEARFLLGTQQLAAEDPAAAVIDFRRARELKVPDDRVVPALAEALVASGQERILLEQLGGVRLQDPAAMARLSSSLALAHASQGSLARARQAVTEALQADPTSNRARLAAARITAAEGNTQAALAAVDALLKEQPANDEAWVLKGDLHSGSTDQREVALAAYVRAVELNPKHLQAHSAIVAFRLLSADLTKGREALEALAKVSPDGFYTNYYRARLDFLEGNYSKAQPRFQALMKVASDNEAVLLAAGLNELQLKNSLLADSLLSRVVGLKPGNFVARFYLAQAKLELGQPEQASKALAPLLEGDRASAQVLVVAAQAQLLQGNAKAADALYTRAAKLDSKDPSVLTALALAKSAGGETDAAMRELQAISAASDDVQADRMLIAGHMAKKNFDLAIKAIDVLQRKQPAKPAAYDLRGQILLEQGKLDDARSAFDQALQKEKSYMPTVNRLTELDVREGKLDQARKRLTALQAAEPGNSRLLVALAILQVQTQGSATQVRSLLEKATKIDPSDVDAWLLLVTRHLYAGDTRSALNTAQAANAAVPDNALLVDALGRAQVKAGDTRQALNTYASLLRLDPKSPLGHLGQAGAQVADNDLEGAAMTLRRFLANNPRSVEGHMMAVRLAAQRRQFKEAVAVARSLQRQFPEDSYGDVVEGFVEMQQGNWNAAVASLRKGLGKRAPEQANGLLHQALLRAGKPVDADQLAGAWLKEHPKDATFITYLGDVAVEAKDPARAQQLYDQALSIEPEHVAALNNMAWLLIQQKKPGALSFAQRAAAVAPGRPEVIDTLALAYAGERKFAKAVEVLKRGIESSTDPVPLRLALAKVHIEAAERSNAIAELEGLVALGRASPIYDEARKLLAAQRKL